MPTLEETLQQDFGFTAFRPGQRELVEAVLAGHDALGILPTGSGKTLCYQLPAQLLGGLTVVVEPLLALMDDQVARLQARGEKRAVTLSSRLTPQDFAWVVGHLGAYRFLFVSPETLLRPDVQAALQRVSVACLVVDEAHCISQWGPDFRPAYLRLAQIKAALAPRCTLALTATAPKRVQQDIITSLRLNAPQEVITSVDRPNIFLGVEMVATPAAKRERVVALVQHLQAPTIVYFDRRAEAEAWSDALVTAGVAASYYHAGLDDASRALIQRQFMAGQLTVICATSAFGMGIDKADVRLVVYTYAPESLEAYSQGIGRAGRDGQPSASLVVVAPGDLQRAAQFAQALPDPQLIATVFAHPEAYEGADDPQIDLVLAYAKARFSQAQVQQRLAARSEEKLAGVQAVIEYLTHTGCRRALWLRYFDAPVRAHDDFCCGALNDDVVAKIAPGELTPAIQGDWRQVFRQLFNEV
ncbi:RecQ family ATP-dependent DNA helicase [Lacticaseibacillus sp. GG6-2]